MFIHFNTASGNEIVINSDRVISVQRHDYNKSEIKLDNGDRWTVNEKIDGVLDMLNGELRLGRER